LRIQDLPPDVILLNGKINTLAEGNDVVQALAIKDGRIIALGADTQIEPIAGANTKRLDLEGRTVIPGLFDSHAHLQEVGLKLTAIRLDECQSPEEMMELVRERAQETPPGKWIIGMGWNEGNFCDSDLATVHLPTRHDIDPATKQHPVLLQRFFNTDVVNSVALRLANITCHTPDPTGGRIERDPDGTPNGLLRASAKQLVRSLVPRPTIDELQDAIRLGCLELNQYGITSVIDPGLMPYEMRAYQAYHRIKRLTVRTNVMPSWHGFRDHETEAQLNHRATELGLSSGLGDAWLRMGGLKMALDGGTSPRTALMYEPFEGETQVRDYNRISPRDLRRYMSIAQEWGWDVGIHVCGDRAMDIAVDALADVARTLPRADTRHNIIHAYFPSHRALEQMAAHSIGAVIQPTFIYWEGDLIFRDVGVKRASNYKPTRKYLDSGIVVAASSDVPSTVSANPYVALYTLVTRKNNLGHYIARDQAMTREEALRSYTISGTWLTREEHLKGTIELGKLADLAVLDRDYFSIPDEAIKDIQTEMTLVDGDIVWEKT
jgi:predicted amidohydrolase YtcJ